MFKERVDVVETVSLDILFLFKSLLGKYARILHIEIVDGAKIDFNYFTYLPFYSFTYDCICNQLHSITCNAMAMSRERLITISNPANSKTRMEAFDFQ